MQEICGIIHHCGRYMEPVACAFPLGHLGEHAWATLPTFTDGMTKTEKAARHVVNSWNEFGADCLYEWMDSLESMLKADMEECKSRTDLLGNPQ